MEKESLRRLRIHPAVFYRQYDDHLVLYHTGQKGVFTLTETAGDMFKCVLKGEKSNWGILVREIIKT